MDEEHSENSAPKQSGVPDVSDQIKTIAFVRQHTGWMLRLARCYMADAALAEDAVQSAFSKIFDRSDQFEGKSSIQSWMRRIVVNESLMLLRKRQSLKKEDSIDLWMPEFDDNKCRIEEPWSAIPNAEQLLMMSETRDIVMNAIDRLPDVYRIVLLLRDIEEHTTAEVAVRLEISVTNVKTRLHRARAALKTLLEPQMRKGGLR